jgi:addiction module HigA family antidote
MRRPVHPGEVLAEELTELGVTPTELARQIGVPANRISQIIAGKRSITGDTALRLGHWFGMSPEFWLNLQTLHDLRIAERAVGAKIAKLPRRPAA